MSWKKYFTASPKQEEIPAQFLNNQAISSSGTSSNYSSYLPEVYAGHPHRIQRYYQYDDMDRDSDISAALDTIADFCTQSEEQNDHPFNIRFHEDPNETEVTILNKYLSKWIKTNNFRSRLWEIFRNSIKNGDAFFLRDPETKEWIWVDHYNVEMVRVDEENANEPKEYFIRAFEYNKEAKFATKKADISQYRTPFGISSTISRPNIGQAGGSFQMTGGNRDPRMLKMAAQGNELFVVDADHVIHLSLSVGMDINWPFGKSVLEAIFKTFKQKELLEDSIIIYRVQRAPERRVFYIDVGSMAPPKARAHIDQIKNEIHQRRIPNQTGGGASVLDASYNPLSIIEDYFFAQCLTLDTKIPLLDGRELTLAQIIKEYEDGKVNYTYSLNKETHELEPGKISWAGITRRNAQLVRVMLDNGEYVDSTPDHRFILRDGSEVEAQYLTPNTSLMPLYLLKGRTGPKQKGEGYFRYVSNADGKKKFVHTTICPKPKGRDYVVHHKNLNSLDNNPENLEVMTWKDHEELHKAIGTYSLEKQWGNPEARKKIIQGMRNLYDDRSEEFDKMLSSRNRSNGSNTWKNPESADRSRSALKAASQNQAKKRKLVHDENMFQRLVELYNDGFDSISKLVPVLKIDQEFQKRFKEANKSTKRAANDGDVGSFISDSTLNDTVRVAGYNGWADFKQNYRCNHKVVSVQLLDYREDTGDITVESFSDSHVFAVSAGVYVHNSAEGRGSKVETLAGGDNLGEIGDLTFFSKKMARGLRIPTSYLALGDEESGQGAYNDGKLGAALIQEYRFNKYCMRLQGLLAPVFDREFKRYLADNGVVVEPSIYEIEFNPPQNFTKYRQIEIDQAQASVYQMLGDNKKLSERFKMKRFLGLTDDEILDNERLWSEENASKLKAATGMTSAESEETDLTSIGIRPPDDDFGMDDFGPDPASPMGGPEGPPPEAAPPPPDPNTPI